MIYRIFVLFSFYFYSGFLIDGSIDFQIYHNNFETNVNLFIDDWWWIFVYIIVFFYLHTFVIKVCVTSNLSLSFVKQGNIVVLFLISFLGIQVFSKVKDRYNFIFFERITNVRGTRSIDLVNSNLHQRF